MFKCRFINLEKAKHQREHKSGRISALKSIQGFTLIESIVVLGVLAVISGIAAPAMQVWVSEWHVEKMARDIVHLVQESKIKAAQSGVSMVICGVDGQSEPYRCTKGRGVAVIAFADVDRNRRFSSADFLFRSVRMNEGSALLAFRSNRARFLVRPNGTLRSTPGSMFVYTVNGKVASRRVIIDRVGRTRVAVLPAV